MQSDHRSRLPGEQNQELHCDQPETETEVETVLPRLPAMSSFNGWLARRLFFLLMASVALLQPPLWRRRPHADSIAGRTFARSLASVFCIRNFSVSFAVSVLVELLIFVIIQCSLTLWPLRGGYLRRFRKWPTQQHLSFQDLPILSRWSSSSESCATVELIRSLRRPHQKLSPQCNRITDYGK